MLTFSEITNRYYEPSECCYIGNPQQFIRYLANGAVLYDIIPDVDKDGRDCALFIFNRAATKPLFDKWCKRELKSPPKEEKKNE